MAGFFIKKALEYYVIFTDATILNAELRNLCRALARIEVKEE